jgi:hypothetical protein
MSENVRSTENSELTEKQEALIVALLSLPTIEAAAKATDISDRTARRWFQLPHFQEAYRAAKSIAFDHALEGLRDCTKEAIDTLKSNLKAEEASVQVRAAHILLTQGIQVHKIEALEARIAELEDALKAGRT